MADNRVKTFLNTFSIYAIGTIGAKLIAFLLIPLYTFFLAQEEMGYFDVAISFIMLLVPFITFDMRDGAFRYLIDRKSPVAQKDVISYVVHTLSRNSIIVIILSIIGYFYLSHLQYYPILVATLIAYACYEVMIQVVRGLGHTKLFVALGIINTALILLLSVLFLTLFHWGALSIFLANLISRVITLCIIECKLHIIPAYLKHRKEYNTQVGREILQYTLPLLPNVLAWWLIENSSRIFIINNLGLDYNGIFAVAIKFSNILQLAATIVYQTWQETAIKEMHAADRDHFFSRIFNTYFFLLSAIVVIATLCLKLLYPHIVATDFQESFTYVYPLFVAVLLHALGSFLDLAYQCSRKTYRGLPSIISTALLAVVLCHLSVEKWQLMGISISLLLSYLYLLIYRIFDTRFAFRITLGWLSLLAVAILTVGAILAYSHIHPVISILIIIVGLITTGYYTINHIIKEKA